MMDSTSFPTCLSVVSSSICARPRHRVKFSSDYFFNSNLIYEKLVLFPSGSALYPLQTSFGGHICLAAQPGVSLRLPPLLSLIASCGQIIFLLDSTKVSLCQYANLRSWAGSSPTSMPPDDNGEVDIAWLE
jgi:hypothetical protein